MQRENDVIINRRAFFKKTAKLLLPILAVGLGVNVPHLAMAASSQKKCQDCASGCVVVCSETCKRKCKAYCKDNCYSNCNDTCKTKCVRTCYGQCRDRCFAGSKR